MAVFDDAVDGHKGTFWRPVHRSGLIHYSDHASLYVSIKGTERLAQANIEPSAGSVSERYDHALAETVNGHFKTEVFHRRGPSRSFDTVDFATPEWANWFKNNRFLESIGNVQPAEARQRYDAVLDGVAIAA